MAFIITAMPIDNITDGEAANLVRDSLNAVIDAVNDLGSAANASTTDFDPAGAAAAVEASLGGAASLDVGTTAGTVAAGDDSRFSDARTPTAHASSHVTGGSDAIQSATSGQNGLMTSAYASKLDGIEAGADVTDAANVAAAGALMTSALGTGVATALGVNVGTAGAPVVNGGALGTPSSGTLTSCTGLPTAGLVDDAVTLAKMAAGTAGNLITYDASGNPAAVSTGTAGQVLTSNGAGAAPTFQTPSGGGGSTKQFVGSDTQYTFTTETWEDINLSLSVTVTTGQKVYVRGTVQIATPGNACIAGIRLVRDSTAIGVGTPTGSRLAVGAQTMSTSDFGAGTSVSEHVDEPSAGTYTYKVQARLMTGAGGAVYINRTAQNADGDYQGAARSSLFTEVY